MPYSQDLAALITIRNFLMSADENVQCKLSKEESNGLRAKAIEIDREIVSRGLKFDPSEAKAVVKSFTSSVDVNQLMEAVDSIQADGEDEPDLEDKVLVAEKPVKVKHKIVKHG